MPNPTPDTIEGFPVEAYERLFLRAFPGEKLTDPFLGGTDEVIVATDLAALLTGPKITLVSIGESGDLAGFSLAMPIDEMHPDRGTEGTEAAYIYITAVDPDLQGQGRVKDLMDLLLPRLRAQQFSFIERDCVIENGYADKVSEVYKDAILEWYDHEKFPENGPERFFRIDLARVAIDENLGNTG